MNEILGNGIGPILLGAGLTLVGVCAGWLISTISARASIQPKRSIQSAVEARQLAVRTIIALDEFVGACHAAVSDNPEFNPADPLEFAFHVEDPRLSLPRDVEWGMLQPDLVEQLMWMRNRVRNVLDGLDSLDIASPAFGDLFERREEDFSRLGIRALDLIETIRSKYKLQNPERPSYYDPRSDFQGRIDRISEARRRRKAGKVAETGEATNVTPLFSTTHRAAVTPVLDGDPKG